MGNVPTKESRGRSSTFSGTGTEFAGRTARRNTTSSADVKKLKRLEEKDSLRDKHWRDLVVRLAENVDGGFLAPHGTYQSNLDFDTDVVRRLVVQRQLAPFFTPLNDFDLSWTRDELFVLLSQLPLHSVEDAYSEDALEEDDVDNHKIHKSNNYFRRQELKRKLKQLMDSARDMQKKEEAALLQQKILLKEGKPVSSALPSRDLLLRLYHNAVECPICFLYYPSNLNLSRCCLQPICTECFVQIKRLDPHPPHDDPTQDGSNPQARDSIPHTLISEPAHCPYCAMADFGVIYDPLLDLCVGINGKCAPGEYRDPNSTVSDGPSSATPQAGPAAMAAADKPPADKPPPASLSPPEGQPRPRRRSMAATDPGIVTIDTIRPDWEQKLISAKNKLARRAAAASAIHASNLIIDGDQTRPNPAPRQRGGQTYNAIEERMIEEALRLSLLDEEERRRRAGDS